MIRFAADRDGKPIFGFGLSEGNLRLLREKKPIIVDLEEMGGQGEVVIFWGETETQMQEELQAAGLLVGVEVHKQEPVQPGEFEK